MNESVFENEVLLFHVPSGRQQVLQLTNQPPVLEIQEEGGVSGVGGICFMLPGTVWPRRRVCWSLDTWMFFTERWVSLTLRFPVSSSKFGVHVISKETSSRLVRDVTIVWLCVFLSRWFLMLPSPGHSRLNNGSFVGKTLIDYVCNTEWQLSTWNWSASSRISLHWALWQAPALICWPDILSKCWCSEQAH